jgi:hypothetical protein
VPLAQTSAVLGIDDTFDWLMADTIPGHYYLAYQNQPGADLTNKRQLRKFSKSFEKSLRNIKIDLGKMSTSEIERIAAEFTSE